MSTSNEIIELIKLVDEKLIMLTKLKKGISGCKINEEANNYYVRLDLK